MLLYNFSGRNVKRSGPNSTQLSKALLKNKVSDQMELVSICCRQQAASNYQVNNSCYLS